MIVDKRVRRGAIELAALGHVLEQGDGLGRERECIWGLNTS